MKKKVENYKSRFFSFIGEVERYCYMARAIEYQEEAANRLKQFQADASELKHQAIECADEEAANCCLCFEEMATALHSEFRMWIEIKQDKMNKAWECLIDAQSATRSAMQAHDLASHLETYSERLQALEKFLFPPQLFMSAGFLIEESVCTICGENYDSCEHIKGRPYMGRLCARKITKAMLEEGSIVDTPANKRCRAISVETDEGTRNWMTWRMVQD